METKQIVKIALAVLVVVIIFRMLRGSHTMTASMAPEHFEDFDPSALGFETIPPAGVVTSQPKATTGPGVTGPPVGPAMTLAPTCISADLLPKPSNKADGSFGEFAPTAPLAAQNFLDASKLIGVDTQGSSMKNANHSLRRDPPISKVDVGPWLSSSISSDLLRKPLDC